MSLLGRVSSILPGVGMVPLTFPEGDHAANGFAEVVFRAIKAQTRILRSSDSVDGLTNKIRRHRVPHDMQRIVCPGAD